MCDRFDAVILASCGEKTRKFRILRGTTSIIIMNTHDNKAVCLVQPGSCHKKVLGITAVNMGSADYRFHCSLLYFTALEDVVQT